VPSLEELPDLLTEKINDLEQAKTLAPNAKIWWAVLGVLEEHVVVGTASKAGF
jgi:hypothetical protein